MTLLLHVPEVGNFINVMGVRAKVMAVEPASDWAWHIELSSDNAVGYAERWSIDVPTDYRTTDGKFALDLADQTPDFHDADGIDGFSERTQS